MGEADPLAGEPIRIRSGVSFQVAHCPGRSPALVFLHGALGNRFNWRSQYEHALERGWRALAYDLGGHGQSSRYRRYSIGRHCRDLHRLLTQLGIERPILCGHSYGVPIALEYAHLHPVRGLVLAAGGTHDLDPWWEAPLMRWMEGMGRHLFHAPLAQEINRRLVSAEAGAAVERFFLESPMPTERDPYRSMGLFWGYDLRQRREQGAWRRPPALVFSGGRDPVFSRAMGDTLAAQFTNGRHHHLSAAGHLVMAEEPQEVNRAISDWIDAGFEQQDHRCAPSGAQEGRK